MCLIADGDVSQSICLDMVSSDELQSVTWCSCACAPVMVGTVSSSSIATAAPPPRPPPPAASGSHRVYTCASAFLGQPRHGWTTHSGHSEHRSHAASGTGSRSWTARCFRAVWKKRPITLWPSSSGLTAAPCNLLEGWQQQRRVLEGLRQGSWGRRRLAEGSARGRRRCVPRQ